MKKIKTFVLLGLLAGSIIAFTPMLKAKAHCEAGMKACVGAADGFWEIMDCISGFFACEQAPKR